MVIGNKEQAEDQSRFSIEQKVHSMHRLTMLFATIALAALTGCNHGTAGGPGAANAAPLFGQTDDTFNLTTPMMATSLRQGQQIEATIGIERAGRFKKDVTLLFSDLPPDVTVEPASAVIKSGSHSAKFTFKAAQNTPVGDFKVKVSGHPPRGADAQNVFKLSVVKG